MDDNLNGTLDFPRFKKAMADYRLGLPDDEAKSLFVAFDINKSGTVDYEEFMRIVRVTYDFFK